MDSISVTSLIFQYKWRVIFTMTLVILESLLSLLFPLVIGLGINDLLQDKYDGLIHLGILGGLELLIGSARRFYDTRVYAGIYCQTVSKLVKKEFKQGGSISKISARSSLLTELVEFLENSMPDIIENIIALSGILVIIAILNFKVFLACLGLLLLIVFIYACSAKANYKLNAGFNSQFERQVELLNTKNTGIIRNHYRRLMDWNIKLSDLETVNYTIIWIGVIALLIFAPIEVVDSGVLKYGMVLAILMYVFDYIENTIMLPLYFQQLIRLKEIANRLAR